MSLKEALEAVLADALLRQLEQPSFGICCNVHHKLGGDRGTNYNKLREIFEAFNLHGCFPVPLPLVGDNHWQGRQLELRLDLMSKMITYLEIQDVQQ